MNSRVYLAVDLGASSGRVMAAVYNGETLRLEEVHRFPNGVTDTSDGLRWDIDGLFSEIKTGIRKAGETYGDAIVSLGVDTWGVDYGLLDADGTLIEPPFAYRDSRTDGMMEAAYARMPQDEIYRHTGIQFMFFNTVFQILSEVIADRPALQKAQRLLFTPDLINYWLTGRAVNEYSIASTGQLLDARTGEWSNAVIEKLELPRRLFGDLVKPGTPLGELKDELVGELGVSSFNVVAVGGHDTASAVAAVPAEEGEQYAYISSGTWSLMGIESKEPIVNDASYAHAFTNEGGVCDTIRVLKNIGGLWLVQECRRVWAEAGDEFSFAELADQAAEAPPFLAIVDPDDPGFATPGDMPERIREWCRASKQPVPETRGELIRVILESLALRYRSVLDALEELAGRRLDRLRLVGGGIQNRLLNQFAANAVQRPVIAGPVEATAIGNVLMQLLADGAIASLSEGRALVAKSFPTETFEPQDSAEWESAYQTFKEIT